MKRSEMVELLRSHIVNCEPFAIEYLEDQTDVASYILKRLEGKGMLPPAYNKPIIELHEGFGGTSTFSVNEWEPE